MNQNHRHQISVQTPSRAARALSNFFFNFCPRGPPWARRRQPYCICGICGMGGTPLSHNHNKQQPSHPPTKKNPLRWRSLRPTGKITQFHQELRHNLVIAPKISVHLRRKSAIYISALYVLCYDLVCSVAPRKMFDALTTAPKYQCNVSTESSSTTDGFFPIGSLRSHVLKIWSQWSMHQKFS